MFGKKGFLIFAVLSGLNSTVFGGDGDLGLPGMPESDPEHQAFLKELEASTGPVCYLDHFGARVSFEQSSVVPAVSLRDAVIPDQASKADLVSAPMVPCSVEVANPIVSSVVRRASSRVQKRGRDDQVVESRIKPKRKVIKDAFKDELRNQLIDSEKKCVICHEEIGTKSFRDLLNHYKFSTLIPTVRGTRCRCKAGREGHVQHLEPRYKNEKFEHIFEFYKQQVFTNRHNARKKHHAHKSVKGGKSV